MDESEELINGISISNLSDLSLRESDLTERRICEIYEIASEIADYFIELLDLGLDIIDIISELSGKVVFGSYEIHPQALSDNRKDISAVLSGILDFDRVVLCEQLIAKLSERGVDITEESLLGSSATGERFTYVRNAFSDEAYDVFSQEFNDPSVKYSQNFKEGALMLSRGEVDYLLLPFEERGGVRLHSTTDIIFRNDFKINAVTPVFGFENNPHLKYALVSKKFAMMQENIGDDRYLELRIGAGNPQTLFRVMSAVRHFGMSFYRISTVCFETEQGESVYHTLVVRAEGESFASLLLEICLFENDCEAVGMYKNLE